jgi:hypothetical protein
LYYSKKTNVLFLRKTGKLLNQQQITGENSTINLTTSDIHTNLHALDQLGIRVTTTRF